jgi:hypothetical protein
VTVQERARANDCEQEFQDVAFREMVRRLYDELRAEERR